MINEIIVIIAIAYFGFSISLCIKLILDWDLEHNDFE